MQEYLRETYFFDFASDVVTDYVESAKSIVDEKARAISLYERVRDDWRYNAYKIHTAKEQLRASAIMPRSEGHCLDKSIVLISCYRAVGLPARLHLAKVKNHIAIDRIADLYGNGELTPHGYVEVFLDRKWIACTPAFNSELCDMLNVSVLEFDGENDSVFQAFDKGEAKFMEYLDDYGTFADFPKEFVHRNMQEHYPEIMARTEPGAVIQIG